MRHSFLRKTRRLVLQVLAYGLLAISSFFALLPLYSCLVISLKPDREVTSQTLLLPPESGWDLVNYRTVLQDPALIRAFVISVLVLLFTLCISTVCSALVACVLFRLEVRGKTPILALYLIASLLPAISLQAPIFRMLSSLRLIDTLFGYILVMCGADIVSVYVFGRYYQEISINLDKAALLDGCGYGSVFFRIHLPLLKDAFLTAAIVKGVYVYNEFYMANLYLMDKNQLPTMITRLYSYLGPFGTRYNVISAACIIVALPVLIVFILVQKRFYSSFSGTGKSR